MNEGNRIMMQLVLRAVILPRVTNFLISTCYRNEKLNPPSERDSAQLLPKPS